MKEKFILLRKIKRSDKEFFLHWWKDPELIGLTSGIFEKSDKVLDDYFESMLKDRENFYFAICYKDKLIGNISLNLVKKRVYEISIVIGNPNYRGKGIGRIAIKKALNFIFKNTDCKRIILEVRPENKRAMDAYIACGFKKIEAGGKNGNYIKMHLSKENFQL
jgi:RimJ/RimL family protein N-acetyltransferase